MTGIVPSQAISDSVADIAIRLVKSPSWLGQGAANCNVEFQLPATWAKTAIAINREAAEHVNFWSKGEVYALRMLGRLRAQGPLLLRALPWIAGALLCGIALDHLSKDDRERLARESKGRAAEHLYFILRQYGYPDPLARLLSGAWTVHSALPNNGEMAGIHRSYLDMGVLNPGYWLDLDEGEMPAIKQELLRRVRRENRSILDAMVRQYRILPLRLEMPLFIDYFVDVVQAKGHLADVLKVLLERFPQEPFPVIESHFLVAGSDPLLGDKSSDEQAAFLLSQWRARQGEMLVYLARVRRPFGEIAGQIERQDLSRLVQETLARARAIEGRLKGLALHGTVIYRPYFEQLEAERAQIRGRDPEMIQSPGLRMLVSILSQEERLEEEVSTVHRTTEEKVEAALQERDAVKASLDLARGLDRLCRISVPSALPYNPVLVYAANLVARYASLLDAKESELLLSWFYKTRFQWELEDRTPPVIEPWATMLLPSLVPTDREQDALERMSSEALHSLINKAEVSEHSWGELAVDFLLSDPTDEWQDRIRYLASFFSVEESAARSRRRSAIARETSLGLLARLESGPHPDFGFMDQWLLRTTGGGLAKIDLDRLERALDRSLQSRKLSQAEQRKIAGHIRTLAFFSERRFAQLDGPLLFDILEGMYRHQKHLPHAEQQIGVVERMAAVAWEGEAKPPDAAQVGRLLKRAERQKDEAMCQFLRGLKERLN